MRLSKRCRWIAARCLTATRPPVSAGQPSATFQQFSRVPSCGLSSSLLFPFPLDLSGLAVSCAPAWDSQPQRWTATLSGPSTRRLHTLSGWRECLQRRLVLLDDSPAHPLNAGSRVEPFGVAAWAPAWRPCTATHSCTCTIESRAGCLTRPEDGSMLLAHKPAILGSNELNSNCVCARAWTAGAASRAGRLGTPILDPQREPTS